ncbi:major capsid protein [Luteimonas sp. JM171]|nr:major capsid protein [Luteimonas sp. JM171]
MGDPLTVAEAVEAISMALWAIAAVGTAALVVRAAIFAWKSVLRRMVD